METLDVDSASVEKMLEAARSAPRPDSIRGAITPSSSDSGVAPKPVTAARKRGSLPRISLGFVDNEPSGAQGPKPHSADLSVVTLLAEGGMGAVYLAQQRSLGREVAVKCLRADVRQPVAVESLLREAKTTGGLEHPNIVPIHALGQDEEGGPVLVMKRVEGTSWRVLLDEPDHGTWSKLDDEHGDRLAAHLHVMVQVCNALEFAHSRGVLHRDIKPDNVMIGLFGEVYLLDWGIAVLRAKQREAVAGAKLQVLGTPYYMAPEMVSGDESAVDERTDVYLLGATLHEILTGKYRHDGANLGDILLAAALSQPVSYRSDVPPELAALCNDATNREPEHRPQSVEAFRRVVSEYVRHRGSIALTVTSDATFEKLLAIPGAKDLAEAALVGDEAREHMSEARFGYLQALREWPGNTRARIGLDACLAMMIEREVLQRNPDAASALLREMSAPAAALRAKVETLAAEIAAQKARDEQARRDAKEMDSSVSARARVAVMALALGVSVYLAADSTRTEMRTGRPISMTDVLSIDAVIFVAMLLGIALARRSLFANRISRQMTWLGLTAVTSSFVSDLLVYVDHGTSRTAGMHTLLVLGACIGVGSILLLPGLWIASVVLFAGAVVSALWPATTSFIVTLATAGTLMVVIHQILKHAKRPSRPAA